LTSEKSRPTMLRQRCTSNAWPSSRHYSVIAKIGAGGMGELYRAHDQYLSRDVAIKVPEIFSRDRDRLMRFEREARLVAALNHPKRGHLRVRGKQWYAIVRWVKKSYCGLVSGFSGNMVEALPDGRVNRQVSAAFSVFPALRSSSLLFPHYSE
jgi:serine/threonine protein kinase